VFSSKTRPFCRDGTEFRKNHGETRILQLTFRFGCTSTRLLATPDEAVLELPHKLLSGPGVESWHLPTMTFCGRSAEDIHWWRSEHHGLAVVHRPVSANTMVDSTRNIYRQLLNGLTDLSPSRFWNFIPGINRVVGELDVYKMFCLGRSEAFAPWSEGHDNTRLPAASAVGTPDDQLTVVMLCTAEPMVPVENPQQIPAYRYPQRYGPRAPSFARASLVGSAAPELYVSGTASIVQSESMHEGDPASQLALACDNIDLVVRASAPAKVEPSERMLRHTAQSVRMYLRNPVDWNVIGDLASQRLTPEAGVLNVVQADICRPELLVEVEARLHLPRS
jgi:chorismate lyase / 3-hydroxybenzoate synthase